MDLPVTRMKTLLPVIVLFISLLIFPICQSAQESKASIVLPNPKLLTCKRAVCSQIWLNTSANNAFFPKQVIIDAEMGCVYGMTAVYEKTVSFDQLRSAIDDQYGKWVVPPFDKPPLGLWRIESEKFAIQLSVNDKKDAKRGIAEAGTKQVILIAFGGRSACAH